MRKLFLGIAILMAGCSGGIEGDARKAVKSLLNDPDSAQFFDVQRNGDNVCGLVNAKNRMGGYVGKTPFMYFGEDKEALIVKPAEESDVRAVWLGLQTENGLEEAMFSISHKCQWGKDWQDTCGYAYPAQYRADICEPFLGDPKALYGFLKDRYAR